MDRPLSIPAILDYAAEVQPNGAVVSVATEGGLHRTPYAALRGRVAQLASALRARGKVSKLELRKLLKDYVLPTAA